MRIAAFGVILAVAVIFLLARTGCGERILSTLNRTGAGTKATVVLDAGHGGFDPGKVGTAGTLEKDINLAIAQKVQKQLEDSGYTVIMTREADEALCTGNEKSRKLTDMKNRVQRIEEAQPSIAVSIHQNSYSAGTKGAQVFYYSTSEEGKRLANVMQETLKELLADGNRRVEKPNDSYYMLRKVTCPLVIVECGFLSNPDEEALLCDENYQGKMAAAICEGIESYLYR